MSQEVAKWQPPTLTDLAENVELFAKDDILNIALNQEPPERWQKQHPSITVVTGYEKDDRGRNIVNKPIKEPLKYLPIDKQRLLAKRLFGVVQVEIRSNTQMFNSVCVTVRVHYKHPITGEALWMDGIGAVGVQTDAGATASDMSKIKFDGVMKAAPSAASYAEKNAYDKLGRAFGGEIQKDAIRFDEGWSMYAQAAYDNPTLDDVKDLFDLKREAMTGDEINDLQRIINANETKSFKKAVKLMSTK